MAHRGHEPVSFAVEGIVDQAVVLKLFEASGVASGTPYVCDGIGNLRQRLDGFNAGAASPSLARAFERCETFSRQGTWS